MADALVACSVSDGLATLTLTRPEAGNALSAQLVADFAAAAEAIAQDRSIRAVLIEAQGPNFCVGGDIRNFTGEAAPDQFIAAHAARLHAGIMALAELRAPVVAAVQGAAAGAGLSLVALADVAIGARSSFYAMAYTAIGLTPDGGATWFLPRLIGLRRTQELALFNRRLTAEEAERYGLITRVVDDEVLTVEARAVARQLAAGPTFAFGQVKRLLAESHTAPLAAQLAGEAETIGLAMATADAQGAIRAFLARETPSFNGQ